MKLLVSILLTAVVGAIYTPARPVADHNLLKSAKVLTTAFQHGKKSQGLSSAFSHGHSDGKSGDKSDTKSVSDTVTDSDSVAATATESVAATAVVTHSEAKAETAVETHSEAKTKTASQSTVTTQALASNFAKNTVGQAAPRSNAMAPPPTPLMCEVPWPIQGRWTDCIPETLKNPGESCTWEHQFGHQCLYEDGGIDCNARNGKFERDYKGPQQCTKMHSPKDRGGCARYDLDTDTCKTTEGCEWNGENSYCQIVCRATPGCGVELHRRDVACQFNCPLQDPSACTAWQAGCACIQDTTTIDCAGWCTKTNTESFVWLKERRSTDLTSLVKMKDALETNALGYDQVRLCQDACFMRGLCVSPPAVAEGETPTNPPARL